MLINKNEMHPKEDVSADAVRIGPDLIFGRLWNQLGIGAVIRSILASTERKFEFDVEKAIFLTVMQRKHEDYFVFL